MIKAIFYKQENEVLYERFKKLNKLPYFTNKQFANIFSISLHGAILWIKDKKRKNYIDILKIKKGKHHYILSNKAKDLLYFLENCKLQLEKN